MSPLAAPSEAIGFLEELANMLASGDLNMARLRQIEIRAARLVKLNTGHWHICATVMFMANFGLGNRIQSEAWINDLLKNKALIDKVMLLNAAHVLTNFASNNFALDVLNLLFQKYPGDPQTLMVAHTLYDRMGHIFSAAKTFDDYVDRVITEEKMSSPYYQLYARECAFCTGMGFSEADLSARLLTAIEAVRSTGFEILRQTRHSLNDGSFIQEFFVDADASVCADLTFDIADALADRYENSGADVFSISCRPLAHFSEENEVMSL
jgi:hypothetical protein